MAERDRGLMPLQAEALWRKYLHARRRGNGHADAARNELIVFYLPLALMLAREAAGYLPPYIELDDLESWAAEGLLRAIQGFKREKKRPFGEYARRRIRGAIKDGMREMDWVPRLVRKDARTLRRGLVPAGGAGMSEDRRAAAERPVVFVSLGRPHGKMELIADVRAEPPEIQDEFEALMSRLWPPRTREIFRMRYLRRMTLRAIGARLGVNEARVCQIVGQALKSLRRKCRSDMDGGKS